MKEYLKLIGIFVLGFVLSYIWINAFLFVFGAI